MNDSDIQSVSLSWPLTRRTFIRASGFAAAAGFAMLSPGALAEVFRAQRPEILPELDATSPTGIDLYIKKLPLRVDGRVSDAVTINGSIPGPIIRMREGEEAIIRV
ncbi:MAG: multicopper oxidase domain-containing protein, partial [Thalassospira sp.]|nr:multicopper oxidase domain-containing protein [Thalassospira sp.]